MKSGAEILPGADASPGIVLFLGMVRRGEFESLEKRGLPLAILVDTNAKQRLGDVSRFVLVERFDFSRPLPELIEAVREIQKQWAIGCLFNVIEFYVAQTAEVAAALGLPGISPASAALCLDKSLMRERFQQRIGPGASARFHIVTSEFDLLDSAAKLGYPVFLQPANISASMWGTRNTAPEMLVRNYWAMVSEVPKYYERLGKKNLPLVVVIAEYLQGSNTSVDCLADAAGQIYPTPVVDVLTGQDIGIDDYHHFARVFPSRLSTNEQQELQDRAAEGMKALDMTSCASHVEFIGSRLGEIAARPGGNRPRILEMACGLDMLHAYYQVLRGERPDLAQNRKMSAAIITPFPRRNGVLREIRHLDRIPQLPGYLYHEVRGQIGQPVGLANGGFRAPLYLELVSSNADEVRRGVDQVASWRDLYEVE